MMTTGGISKAESECPLCKAAATEEPEMSFIGGASWDPKVFVILPTKDLKGHKFRYMILSKEHVAEVNNAPQAEAYLYYFMRTKIGNNDLKAFDILMPTHATVTDHFHRVASSWDGEGENGKIEDQDKIYETDRVEVIFQKRWGLRSQVK